MDTVDNHHAELHIFQQHLPVSASVSFQIYLTVLQLRATKATCVSSLLYPVWVSVVWKLQAHSLICIWSFIMEQVWERNPSFFSIVGILSSANTAIMATFLFSTLILSSRCEAGKEFSYISQQRVGIEQISSHAKKQGLLNLLFQAIRTWWTKPGHIFRQVLDIFVFLVFWSSALSISVLVKQSSSWIFSIKQKEFQPPWSLSTSVCSRDRRPGTTACQGCCAMGTNKLKKKCAGRTIRFCTGLTRAAKAGQKSIVPARRAQQTNSERTPFICSLRVPKRPMIHSVYIYSPQIISNSFH